MRMVRYTAKMKHSSDTVQRLVLMQYNTFQTDKKLIRAALSAALIIYGIAFFDSNMFTPILALFLGCVLLAGMSVRPKHNAQAIIKQMGGHYPSSLYSFSDKGFRDSEASAEIPYTQLIKLIDDRKYLYLYINRQSAYMVNDATVTGEGGLDGLKELIAGKSGQKWSSPMSFWNFSIRNVREMTGRDGDGFEGPRLKDRRH